MDGSAEQDMEENIWRNFPEDLFMKVLLFLPVRSLLRFCTVSKLWNSIPKDPKFHEIRDSCWREFIDEVLACRKFQHYDTYFKSCANGFLLMICTGDFVVIRPSKLSLRQIPRPEWNLDGQKYDLQPVGMVVDERTRDYAVIVQSRVRTSWQARDEFELGRPDRAPWEWDRKVHLHQFKSGTAVWSWCGTDRRDVFLGNRMIGVALHRDFLRVLVWRHTCYQLYRDNGARFWDVVPGKDPDYLGLLSEPLFFSHRGNLYLAQPHASGCSLWEYRADTSEWALTNLVFNTRFNGFDMNRDNADSEAINFAVVAEDFIYFGKLFPGVFLRREEFIWRSMKYNLISRALEAMSVDEVKRMLLTHPRSRFPFLFKAA